MMVLGLPWPSELMVMIGNRLAGIYRIAAVISVYGSPSCGYSGSFSNSSYGGELCIDTVQMQLDASRLEPSPGIFMNEFSNLMKEHDLAIPFVDFMEEDPAGSIEKILSLLGNK